MVWYCLPFCLHYTSDRYYSQSWHLQNFPNDSAIVGWISKEHEYRSVVDTFVEYKLNHLQLIIKKTKELMVDFRTQRNCTGS